MTKPELILKAIMAPGEPVVAFVENYIRLVPDHEIDTFRAVVEMKGYKKNDIHLYVEVFKSKLQSVAAAAAAAVSTTPGTKSPSPAN